ncbi:hypothetical protein MHH42_31120 [Bacillus sp. FSL L8-0099]|uniref:hypothetical protein n=1 Tax=unclassified Bacillus (in: firmicutes) TaxID=185979 RepID=UPI0030F8EF30
MDFVDLRKLDYVAKRLENEKENLISLLPSRFSSRLREELFVSGGCIYSLYNNQEPKDIDTFIKSRKLVNEIVDFFSKQRLFMGRSIGVKKGFYHGLNLIMTDNAVSLGKYQIITRFTGTPEEVISQFDFKHNMFYVKDGSISTLSNFSYLCDNKLVYNDERARDICGTIIRVAKFVKRGMDITNEEMSKMLLKLNEVGFNERELEILSNHQSNKSFGS